MKRMLALLLLGCLLLPAAFADGLAPLEIEDPGNATAEDISAGLSLPGDLDVDLAPAEDPAPGLFLSEGLVLDPAPAEGALPEAAETGNDASADTVPVDAAHFPDAEFRRLITNRYANSDGTVSLSRLAGVTSLDYYIFKDYSIASLKGIEYFTGLQKLDCAEMKLTRLDVSRCTELGLLSCWGNQLASLDIHGCTKLHTLYCESNQLTHLDVHGLSALKYLICKNNRLTELDIGGCVALDTLDCTGNRLKALDAGDCAKLCVLHCADNLLKSLKIRSDDLYYVDCRNNALRQLDISGCKKLIPAIAGGWKDGCYSDHSFIGDGLYANTYLYCDQDVEIVTQAGPVSLSGAEVTLSKDRYIYNGKARKPSVTVTLNGKALKKGTDYKVGYKNNTDIGTARVKVTGIGNYTDSVTVKFSIVGKPVLIAKALELAEGKKQALLAADSPVAAADCTFTSSDEDVAKVNSKGVVKGVSAGQATITVEAKNGGEKARCKVTVTKSWLFVVATTTNALGVGEQTTLTPTVPEGVTVKWSSSDKKIAKVSRTGVVKALKKGKVTITATASSKAGNGDKATCEITVKKAPTRVTVSPARKTLTVGRTLDLTATLPKNSASALRWTSSNPEVATVSNTGRVTAVGGGEAKITVRTFNDKTAQCLVTVKRSPTGVTLDRTELELCVNQDVELKATLSPTDAYPDELRWFSSNDEVATVSDTGKVTAVKVGSARITVMTANGKTAECAVSVRQAKIVFGSEVWNLGYSEEMDINARLTPGKGKITYKSSDPSIATVSTRGHVKAGTKEGKTTITAKSDVYGTTVSLSHELWVYGEGKYAGFTSTPVTQIKSDYIRRIQGVLDSVVEVMGKTSDKEIAILEGSVDTFIVVLPNGSKPAPEDVQEKFKQRLKDEIETFDMGVARYKDVKTDTELVKKVMEQVMGKTGSFTFEATVNGKKKTYTATLTSNVGGDGGQFMSGMIIFPDKKTQYQWAAVAVSEADIQNQMNYLKEYAKIKIDDAKAQVIADAEGLLDIGPMKKAVEKWLKNTASDYLMDEFPRVHSWLTDVKGVITKYNEVKGKLKGAVPPKLDGKLAPDVIKAIAKYNTSFLEFVDMVENLGDAGSLF